MSRAADLAAVVAELKRAASAFDNHPETFDTDALWALLQAVTDAKKVVGDELVQRMLAATKGA